jgi:glycosyltransferase involved in cell wall biosynthesis
MATVSVLMPVHNAGPYVEEAVRSVLRQTFKDFELVVMNDGCTDDTLSRIARFQDPRIRVISNESNLGIARTLNRALDLIRTDWIARMDADDICEPDRLAVQMAFLRSRPGLAAAGGWARLFGDRKPVVVRQLQGSEIVKAFLLFGNALIHPTVMFRRSLLEKNHFRYDPSFSCTEDYELWTRVADVASVDNLDRVVLNLRVHGTNVTANMRPVMVRQTGDILRRQLAKVGIEPTEAELERHHRLGLAVPIVSPNELYEVRRWIARLVEGNRTFRAYPDDAFREVAGRVWFRCCRNATRLGHRVYQAYRQHPPGSAYRPGAAEQAGFMASLLFHTIAGVVRSRS